MSEPASKVKEAVELEAAVSSEPPLITVASRQFIHERHAQQCGGLPASPEFLASKQSWCVIGVADHLADNRACKHRKHPLAGALVRPSPVPIESRPSPAQRGSQG